MAVYSILSTTMYVRLYQCSMYKVNLLFISTPGKEREKAIAHTQHTQSHLELINIPNCRERLRVMIIMEVE